MPPAKKAGSSGFQTLMVHDKETAKQRFDQLNQQNQGLDVLQRCKKLNEFLSSDFLQPGADSKAQLTEMLSILNAPKQRPAFLDKPSVISAASTPKKSIVTAAKTKVSGLSPSSMDFPDQLLDMLEESERIENTILSRESPTPASPIDMQDADDGLDDLIGLLNPDCTPTRNHDEEDSRIQQEKEKAAAAQEQARKEKELQEEKERRKLREEAEERLKSEEEDKRRLKEEELRQKKEAENKEQMRREAEVKLRLQQEEEKRAQELQERRDQEIGAALVLQSCSRRFFAQRLAQQLHREAALAQAAIFLQSRFRSLVCARLLVNLRASDLFRRRRAARIISTSYLEYRKQWRLNPVKGGPSLIRRDSMDGHHHLLELPVRVRNASDLRSAPDGSSIPVPEASGSSAGSLEGSGRRAVESARKRLGEVEGNESRLRDSESSRRLKASSAHRDFQEAFKEVKKGPDASSFLAPRPPKRPPI